jgi:hypothetical protein
MFEEVWTLQTLCPLCHSGDFGAVGNQLAHRELVDSIPVLLVVLFARPVVVTLQELVLNELFLLCSTAV